MPPPFRCGLGPIKSVPHQLDPVSTADASGDDGLEEVGCERRLVNAALGQSVSRFDPRDLGWIKMTQYSVEVEDDGADHSSILPAILILLSVRGSATQTGYVFECRGPRAQ